LCTAFHDTTSRDGTETSILKAKPPRPNSVVLEAKTKTRPVVLQAKAIKQICKVSITILYCISKAAVQINFDLRV